MKTKTVRNLLIEAFCENGVGSSKRIVGTFMIICVMFCTIWSCIEFGMTEPVKSVIETEIITAGALLGITSITNIWKRKPPTPKEEDGGDVTEREDC